MLGNNKLPTSFCSYYENKNLKFRKVMTPMIRHIGKPINIIQSGFHQVSQSLIFRKGRFLLHLTNALYMASHMVPKKDVSNKRYYYQKIQQRPCGHERWRKRKLSREESHVKSSKKRQGVSRLLTPIFTGLKSLTHQDELGQARFHPGDRNGRRLLLSHETDMGTVHTWKTCILFLTVDSQRGWLSDIIG